VCVPFVCPVDAVWEIMHEFKPVKVTPTHMVWKGEMSFPSGRLDLEYLLGPQWYNHPLGDEGGRSEVTDEHFKTTAELSSSFAWCE
jgi:hypothetical protein